MMSFLSRSESETRSFGQQLAKQLPKNSVLCFFGDLGAGKTTLIKGLASALAGIPESQISSPTFTYLNIYEGKTTVYHFDLYRLSDGDEFLGMGFDEYFSADGVCCIEWSERIEKFLPEGCFFVTLTHEGADKRRIEVQALKKEHT